VRAFKNPKDSGRMVSSWVRMRREYSFFPFRISHPVALIKTFILSTNMGNLAIDSSLNTMIF